ncbi:deoxyhypusine synthase family protein [Nanoarchaeota archaeon]
MCEGAGMKHFKYEFGQMDDKKLYYGGYDRIYDTLELESNLDDAEVIMNKVFQELKGTTSSHEINKTLGKYLAENTKGRGVLKSAYEHNVPVYIPAFTDSEMGLDFSLFNKRIKEKVKFDPFRDLEHFTQLMLKSDTLGIFTIGGGVPRNWAQQLGPYLDVIKKRYKDEGQFVRYKYGVRICPEPVHWGGLSGCTYSEGVTWGKFVPKDEGGMQAEVLCDATIALPLMAKALLERLKK